MKRAIPAAQCQQTVGGSLRHTETSKEASSAHNHNGNDKEAVFARMVGDCQERVFRLAFRITHNHADAEDAQQETLLKAHRNLRQFEGRARFTTWISRIAINESLMSLRKRRNTSRVPIEEAAQQAEASTVSDCWQSQLEDPETAYARRELRQRLDSAISQLAPRLRVVFLLRAVEELSTAETARILHLSSSAVKARLRRARHDLEQFLRTTPSTEEKLPIEQPCLATHSIKQRSQVQWVT